MLLEKEIKYLSLYNKIENIDFLDEKKIKILKSLNLKYIIDIIYFFPRTYEDKSNLKKIIDIKADETVVLTGVVLKTNLVKTRTKKIIFQATLSDGTGTIRLSWFQMPYLKKTIFAGDRLSIIGKVKKTYGYEIINPEYKKIDDEDKIEAKVLPVYSSINKVTQRTLRAIIKKVINKYIDNIFENIPSSILKKYDILDRKEAILKIHFPKKNNDITLAKKRFALEELLTLELSIISKRFEVELQNKEKYKLDDNKHLVKKFLDSLSFELTNAQKKVITEIYKDLINGKIVNRLIQGDVGSGKTIVATIMMLYMVENGYQTAIMAPTEILAVQHYLSMVDSLYEFGIKVDLLTSSIKGKRKEKLLNEIKHGLTNIIIGTHSLIEDNVEFNKLGLVVIDEQHRFGVLQRRNLRNKGVLANLIVMSATPIPRSLALSIYGDLDISIINELPPGRIPIKTKWIQNENELNKMYNFIRKQLGQARQAYFVAPLIDESESLNVKSATELYEELKNKYFSDYKVALLHGKMKNSEKDKIMHDFKKKKYDIIVSTTVIEVGINVPNATIMVISDAHRFGLSALHQLRGRVGRGKFKSYCFLVSSTKNELSIKRLEIMEQTTDGFVIAEEDLKLRKIGEIFGTKQSGSSDMQFIDFVKDIKLIKFVKDLATKYLFENNGKIDNIYMQHDINKRYNVEEIKG
ncbi:ATP-dependent DNA helicase RecG [Hypnocyclicus thermotrophus]|uniref:ATP-dependent DNA helicase RecG n=1 Tax=Hypnocyclicus thermotrophus TaxID=1627895 RepID=A0AA46I592_9FUSO|nr:ATP-dependent DNA helicase RecG [Hypnocyclicus thermotrophus]TDT67845.1 ATP-dependent DNA helicase RecG [Hypnocyclicus thermotrophus]